MLRSLRLQIMNNKLPSFVEEFNIAIREAEVFLSITRCSKLQRNEIESLREFQSNVFDMKSKAIAENNEKLANMLLGYECVVDTLLAELEMWILLKQDDPDKAWDKLVAAQASSIGAVRAHEGFNHLIRHYQRLEAIEQLVFPSQVFICSGMIVRHQECSICGGEYEDCEHLKGKPYMGEFCRVIVRDAVIDHAAIVENPANKRCRIMNIEVEGVRRNKMSWRIEENDAT